MNWLFERLEHAARGVSQPSDLRASVALQIQRLVSVHVWEGDSGLHLMDMALPPMVGQHGPDDLVRWTARLEDLIRRHEPRLQLAGVSIEPAHPGASDLHACVTGRLISNSGADLDDETASRFSIRLPRR